jgi:hypothetical protein
MGPMSDLRKEQLTSPVPERHVFRITRKQEREIIDEAQTMFFSSIGIQHISTLFGCRVELVD